MNKNLNSPVSCQNKQKVIISAYKQFISKIEGILLSKLYSHCLEIFENADITFAFYKIATTENDLKIGTFERVNN